MSRPVIVLGGGGHAKVVIDALLRCGVTVLGFTDPDPERESVLGVPRLGPDEELSRYGVEWVALACGIGSVSSTALRRTVFQRFRAAGYEFPAVVHPSAVVAQDVSLGAGAQVMAGAVLQTGARIGENTIINTAACVDHDCRIGPHVHLAPGATLSGSVRVGEGAHIGAGATLIQNVTIGEESIVGAGAVVIGDVPPRTRVVGVPAKV